jgi:CLIP-associating protein 1/2
MVIHKADLNEWLFILLTRLLCKLGADLLASVHSKVVRVLDVVRLVVNSEKVVSMYMNL